MKKIIIIFLLLHGFSSKGYCQDYQQAQNKLKSIFIYNFLKYVEWPAYKDNSVISICLMGQEPIYNELKNLASTKNIQNRKLNIVQLKSFGNCETCDLVFVHASSGIKVEPGQSDPCDAFIVTDNDYNAGISNINLKYKDNRLGFEINPTLCENNGFKIASELKTLAF